jgi:hypothetical protein
MNKDTTKAAPAKRTRRAPAPADIAAAAELAAAEQAAERRAAATAKLTEAEGWIKVLKTAIKAGDADGARAAAEQLAGAAGGMLQAYSARKSGTAPRPRTQPGEGDWAVVDGDGVEIKRSLYKPSVARDIAVARKRLRDGEGRPGDERLAGGKVVAVADLDAVTP